MKKIFFYVLLFSSFINGSEIRIYNNDKTGTYTQSLKNIFEKFEIKYRIINNLNNNIDQLTIVFNVQEIDEANLPKYYISYQTKELPDISKKDLNKLSNAIAIWDFSWDNISKYNRSVYNYYYFPLNYDFSDPVILPCFLPLKYLEKYKEILKYSNMKNTDISSHLPAIFVHSILQNPNMIIECGINTGESTFALSTVAKINSSKLIGIDINQKPAQLVYEKIDNPNFHCMNDLDFPNFYKKNNSTDKADIIFIDTSHAYKLTIQEIPAFLPLLKKGGLFIFHDSNITPYLFANHKYYLRINNTIGGGCGERGVTKAIKEYFSIQFDEYKYWNFTFKKDNSYWQFIHYPFCNGLTCIKQLK